MVGFGHVMKIFIGVGFPRMGFLAYIVCLFLAHYYVNVAYFNLTNDDLDDI